MTAVTYQQLNLTAEIYNLGPAEQALIKEFQSLHNAGKRIFLSIAELCRRTRYKKSTLHTAISKLKMLGLVSDDGWYKRVKVRKLNPDAFIEEVTATLPAEPIAPTEAQIDARWLETDCYEDNSDMWAEEAEQQDNQDTATTPKPGQVDAGLLQNLDTKLNNTNKLILNKNPLSKYINKFAGYLKTAAPVTDGIRL